MPIGPGQPDVLLYEIYTDRAAFDAHLASPHFLAFDTATRDIVTKKTVGEFLVREGRRGRRSDTRAMPRWRRSMLLGCIADDFTGASDLANTLARQGMETLLFAGVPEDAARTVKRASSR